MSKYIDSLTHRKWIYRFNIYMMIWTEIFHLFSHCFEIMSTTFYSMIKNAYYFCSFSYVRTMIDVWPDGKAFGMDTIDPDKLTILKSKRFGTKIAQLKKNKTTMIVKISNLSLMDLPNKCWMDGISRDFHWMICELQDFGRLTATFSQK